MSSDTASSATTTSTVLSTCEHMFCSLIPCFQQCIDRPNIIFIHGFTYHEVLWHLCWVASLSPKHQKNGENCVVICFLVRNPNMTASKYSSQFSGLFAISLLRALKKINRQYELFSPDFYKIHLSGRLLVTDMPGCVIHQSQRTSSPEY